MSSDISQSKSPGAAACGTGVLVLISAPSGAGKTTVCTELLAAEPGLTRAITCTTRAPRAGEQDGVDYYFLAVSTFHQWVAEGLFLEHATVYGNSYGTLKSEVTSRLRKGGDVLLNIDVQGAASIRAAIAGDVELTGALVTVFLCPPPFAVLEERLRRRGTDLPEVIEKRLGVARQEVAEWKHFDYLLTSGTIPEDLRRMRAILEVERMRTGRSKAPGI